MIKKVFFFPCPVTWASKKGACWQVGFAGLAHNSPMRYVVTIIHKIGSDEHQTVILSVSSIGIPFNSKTIYSPVRIEANIVFSIPRVSLTNQLTLRV